MPRTYRVTPVLRFVNLLVRLLVRLGIGPRHTYVLTVRGRKSGNAYSTPVTLVEREGHRWLVAPYGEVGWVRNARAAGRVTLARGGHAETVSIDELRPKESAPILKEYLTRTRIVQPYFSATPQAPTEAFVDEAARHPVFRIRP